MRKSTSRFTASVMALGLSILSLPACSSSPATGAAAATPAGFVNSLCNFQNRCSVDFSGMGGQAPAVVDGFVLDQMARAYLEICGDSGRANLAAEMAYDLALPDTNGVDLAAMAALLDAAPCAAPFAMAPPTGRRAVAAACLSDLQCVSGACTDTQGACGKCIALAPVGGACNSQEPSGGRCAAGADCVNDKCVGPAAVKKAGDACVDDANACGVPGRLACVMSVCTSMTAAVGEACGDGKLCTGSVCDSMAKKCVAFKTAGACTKSYECDVFQGYACAAATNTCVRYTGTVTRAKVGEACGSLPTGTYMECALGLGCDGATKKCVDALSTCAANR